MTRTDGLHIAQQQLEDQATAALNHGGRAITSALRSLLLIIAVFTCGIGKFFIWLSHQLEPRAAEGGIVPHRHSQTNSGINTPFGEMQ